MDRKDFFKKGFRKILGVVKEAKEIKEEIPSKLKKIITKEEMSPEKVSLPEEIVPKKNFKFKNLVHPPGAISEPKKFSEKCTGCGDCIHACPYNAIFPVYESKLGKNLPFMDLNVNACLMCEDFPCIQSCKPKALVKLKKKEKLKLGQAKLQYQFCLNHGEEENYCTSCEESCPVKNVVSYKNGKPSFSKDCTGCGICVKACPTFPKAIVIK